MHSLCMVDWSSTRCALQDIYTDTPSHSKAAWSGNEAMKYIHTLTGVGDSPLLRIHTVTNLVCERQGHSRLQLHLPLTGEIHINNLKKESNTAISTHSNRVLGLTLRSHAGPAFVAFHSVSDKSSSGGGTGTRLVLDPETVHCW